MQISFKVKKNHSSLYYEKVINIKRISNTKIYIPDK